MLRRLMILYCLILVACNPQAAATQPPATEAPMEEQNNPWQNPYDTSKADLCPEDTNTIDQPFFGEPIKEELDGTLVFVQRGLYGNSQNEVFRIIVTGVTEEAVTEYTNALKVCLDYVTAEAEIPVTQEQPTPSSLPAFEPFGANPDDLIIELYAEGFYNRGFDPAKMEEILRTIVNEPTEKWAGLFESTQLTTPPRGVDFAMDLVLDPTVNNSATHQYVERSATRIYVTTSVQYGSGSVKSGICRGTFSTTPISTMTVLYTGTQTASGSDAPTTGYTYKYDLGVKGNPSGTYRISGRLYWGGWSAGYSTPVPPGSAKNCNP